MHKGEVQRAEFETHSDFQSSFGLADIDSVPNVWIGYDAIIETSNPHLVEIQDGASVGIRATIIAHFRESRGVVLEEDCVLGAGVIVLPNVRIGKGAVVPAGSVVTQSVPPMTVVQGNPAVPIAKIGTALKMNVTLRTWVKNLKPIRRP
jgi:acetyltransferase-like isoleucine patch superfamily enzyme